MKRRKPSRSKPAAAKRGDEHSEHIEPPPLPDQEMVRFRAYQIYQARRGRFGDAIGDWTQAERELRMLGGGPHIRQVSPLSRGDILLSLDD